MSAAVVIGALWANYFMTLKLFTDTITHRLCDKSSEFVILAENNVHGQEIIPQYRYIIDLINQIS